MKVIKAMKIAKRNRKAKDLSDLKTRGYTDEQYEYLKKVGDTSICKQYLDIEDNYILTCKIESQI